MKRRNVLVVALLTVVCVLFGLVACKSGTGEARVLASEERTLVLQVEAAEGKVTLLALMEELRAENQIDFKTSGTMISEINGVANAADLSSCWMLYTTDGGMANEAWGTLEYDGKILGSAIVGADSLVVTVGEIYIWSYQTF